MVKILRTFLFIIVPMTTTVSLSAQHNVRPTAYDVIYGGEDRSRRLDVYIPD
jgi:hypothetical protein